MTKADFSRASGVTRAAVSIALSKGRIIAERDGSINPKRPENAAYLESSKRQRRQVAKNKAKRAQKPPPSKRGRKKSAAKHIETGPGRGALSIDGETQNMADLRKTIADANLKEQKLAQDRGELLTRDDVKLVFARLYQVHTAQLKTLAEKLGPDIAAEFKLEGADTLRVQQVMHEEVTRALSQIKRELNEYLDAIGDGSVDEEN
jgi:hypothetical protein